MHKPLNVFCCYAREDQEMLLQLKKHLALLQHQSQITIWSDTDLLGGDTWEKELHRHIESADLILLLISPDFMSSDYCYSVEMQRAIERHNEDKVRVIPILLRPVDWRDAPFATLQMLPTGAKSVTTWNNQDEALEDIARGIRHVVSSLRSPEKHLQPDLDPIPHDTEHQTLYDLLPFCTVKISVTGAGSVGTGFFVAPELILTSTDVITRLSNPTQENDPRSGDGRSALVHWGRNVYAGRFLPLTPKLVDARLGLVELHVGNHPCVLLRENSRPSDMLYTYGYTEEYLSGTSATFQCEGKTMLHREVLKLKGGLISPGMYGAPLLNLRTGSVCGLICHAHGGGKTDGGLAVLTHTIFECLPDLREKQRNYHEKDKRWDNCLNDTPLRS